MKTKHLLILSSILCSSILSFGQFTQSGDFISSAVSNYMLSGDIDTSGTISIVGMPEEEEMAGVAKIYQLDISDTWVQLGSTIVGKATSRFGQYVCMNNDGTIVAISGRYRGSNGSYAGYFRVYEYISNDWSQLGSDIEGDATGSTFNEPNLRMSADGNTILIGDWASSLGGSYAGAIKAYEFNGTNWVQKGQTISGSGSNDRVGTFIDLTPDGENFVAQSGMSSSARTQVYTFVSNSWQQVGTDLATGESSSAVAINDDATVVARGDYYTPDIDNTGLVYVYRHDGSDWGVADDTIQGNTDDNLGSSLDLDGAGSRLIAGAPFGQVARVYDYDNGGWSLLGSNIDGITGKRFGELVKINTSGSALIIGGQAHCGIFTIDTTVTSNSEGITSTTIDIYPNPSSDIIYINNLKKGSIVSVYNAIGDLVMRNKYNGSINISSLNSGMYILNIIDQENNQSTRFIKR